VGKGTCATKWNCRPAITMSVQSGDGNNATVIANNLLWDIGSGCIWDRGLGTPRPVIYNNSCYDYAKGAGGGGPNPEGISGYGNRGTAVVQNNIIFTTNGTWPLDRSAFTASHNLCGTSFWSSYIPWGTICGASSQTWSVNSVLSTDENTATFLTIGIASEARNRGVAIPTLTSSYSGGSRPRETAYDIGAFEYCSDWPC
jgi:hypothetical protein